MKRPFSIRILVNAYATIEAETPEEAIEIAQFLNLSTCSFDDYVRPSDITICDEYEPA